MPLLEARRLCPQGIYIDLDPDTYVACSREIFRLLRAFTPALEPRSVDEAFLDMTATAERFGGPMEAGRRMKDAIRQALDLPATIGIAPNKLLAKLVSGHAKPDGLRWLRAVQVSAYLERLPTRELWGIGEKTAAFLAGLGIRTCGELGRASRIDLGRRLGVVGERLVLMGQGIDEAPVVPDYAAPPAKSVGNERTFDHDLRDWDAVEKALLALSDMVARRLRADGFLGRTVAVKIRFASFETLTRRTTLGLAMDDERQIFAAACALVRQHAAAQTRGGDRRSGADAPREPIRLLGVSVAGLVPRQAAAMLDLFEEDARAARGTAVRDAIRDRFGESALLPARHVDGAGAPDRRRLRSGVVPFGAHRRIAIESARAEEDASAPPPPPRRARRRPPATPDHPAPPERPER
jgi:DNA polymerase-4